MGGMQSVDYGTEAASFHKDRKNISDKGNINRCESESERIVNNLDMDYTKSDCRNALICVL
ncbi:uncharacterized protein G2W53_002112 [Senna tora]|uniref:Uncharacterized protein n=1 Tax=Senna tora TaxID=362788 RepID=A0A835CN61_9FABA|nr:uncharacterized protein G2W53_002112 [Senna tora]